MDPRILQLQSTTFGGERLTRRQTADIQETVSALPLLSRTELGHTVCVHLGWQTPNGHNRIQSAMRLLEALEQLGILRLPARRPTLRGRQRPVVPGARSDPQPEIGGPLAACRPLRLEVVRGRAAVQWRLLGMSGNQGDKAASESTRRAWPFNEIGWAGKFLSRRA